MEYRFGEIEYYWGNKIKIDKRLWDEIKKEFSGETIRYHYEVMNEVWLTAAKLSEQIQFLSKDWLSRYGHLLPRERVVYEDEKGVMHKTSWCYPLHRIQRMIAEQQMSFHIENKEEATEDET